MDKFFKEQQGSLLESFDVSGLLENLDYKKFFNGLIETIEKSSFGPMFMMVGGTAALEPMRDPFTEKMKSTIIDFTKTDDFQNSLNKAPKSDELINKVEAIVKNRLDEHTPHMVKTIIQEMIKKHLGWLVVWGGVFGGLIGLLMSLTK